MNTWPPSPLQVAQIQAEIHKTPVRKRSEAYNAIATFYGVSPMTARRVIPIGTAKPRVDKGLSKAALSPDAEAAIREECLPIQQLLDVLSGDGLIDDGDVSIEQAKRIRSGKAKARPAAPKKSKTDPLAFRAWCRKKIKIRGRKWSLRRHEYMREVCDALEDVQHIVFRKAAQVIVSTTVLLSEFWRNEMGYKTVHYFPTDEEAADFSDDRANILIDESPHLQRITGERARGRDNKGLRHIGRGSNYIRGLFTKKRVKSIDADMVVIDEVDEADQENKTFARDRVGHSDLQHIRELSQPSVSGYGIDQAFARSDQRYWHLRCPGCGELTCLDHGLDTSGHVPIPNNILPVPSGAEWAKQGQQYYRACAHCHSPLDMADGEWIAENPGARVRGYHISRLYSQICEPSFADPADEIMHALQSAHTGIERRHVTISILGLPYGGGAGEITDAVIQENEGHHGLSKTGRHYIGIDQGDEIHAIATDDQGRMVDFLVTTEWRAVHAFIDRHGAFCVGCDALPEKRAAMQAVARAAYGYICYFSQDAQVREGEEVLGSDAAKTLTIDRTDAIDEAVNPLVDGEIVLPSRTQMQPYDLSVYELRLVPHLKMLKKVLVEDAQGRSRYRYLTGVENHFGLALAYQQLARSRHRHPVSIDDMASASHRTARRATEGDIFGSTGEWGNDPFDLFDYDMVDSFGIGI